MLLNRFEQRGWLVSLPDEPAEIALAWFEGLAKSIVPPQRGLTRTTTHYTKIWVTEVFHALATLGAGFWVPLSDPASTPP